MSQAIVQPSTDLPQQNSHVLELAPAVDIYENEHEILLVADTPGTSTEQVSIDVESDQLRLSARATAQDGTNVEYGRRFHVGVAVDSRAITATLNNGILTIKLPKAEAYRSRKIEVRAG